MRVNKVLFLFTEMMLPDSSEGFENSLHAIEVAKQRLVMWKKRQKYRRNIILQHLASTIYLNWEEYSRSFPDDWQEVVHSRMMKLLVTSRISHRSFDEVAYRKRAVL